MASPVAAPATPSGDSPSARPATQIEPPTWCPKIDNPPRDILQEGEKKQKKKKRSRGVKSVAKRGPTALPTNRGTGFEEYYADPPMTAEEAREEREDIYADDLSFEERIESCIKRFRARRRLQGDLTHYFSDYLFRGGIDTNPVPFSGNDPRDLKGLTTAEQHDAKASTIVGAGGEASENKFYTGDRENWSVDFAGVAAGFFSCMAPLTGLSPDATEKAIALVENFLRYVLQHDVCPEYEGDVKRALQVCEDAREEIPMMLRLKAALPGHFNLAAADLFGVRETQDWSFHGFKETGKDPKVSLLTSLALMDEPEVFEKMLTGIPDGSARVIRQFECTVEIVEIQRPDADIAQQFKCLRLTENDGTTSPFGLSAVGKVKFKPATIEDGWVQPPHPSHRVHDGRDLTLYFDDEILASMKPGMKMTWEVCELDTGLKFVKTLRALEPTYYTFLPQQLMRHFKGPRPDQRPAPSVHDRRDGAGIDGAEGAVAEGAVAEGDSEAEE